VEGLYAAGDVVHGLDQISHAMGEGGVAATTIRNDLAARSPLLREPTMPETELEDVEAGD
jgi:thioredoxin reductase (NADPH)